MSLLGEPVLELLLSLAQVRQLGYSSLQRDANLLEVGIRCNINVASEIPLG
jgi:hypothetical protein